VQYDFDDIDSIIAENARRLEVVNEPYNPLVGTPYCDEIQRVRLDIPDAPLPLQYIPIEMESETVVKVIRKAGSIRKAGASLFGGTPSEKKSVDIWRWFCKVRNKYDVEFWCFTQIKIEHKLTLDMVPFKLNRAQRYYLRFLEKLRKANVPIFIILLKARQWGGSTLTQFYMIWIQMFWQVNWNSIIAADTDEHALNVQSMFQRAIEEYDTFITDGTPIKFSPYENMKSTRQIKHRGARITIGSVQHPEFIRSSNIAMAHLTEVGIWPTTPKHDPQSLAQSLAGSILKKPYRLRILESTAKGVGNFFHRTWLRAVKGTNEYTPVFVPWYMIDIYSRQVTEGYEKLIRSFTDYDKMLFRLGATLEAIAYYIDMRNEDFAENSKGIFNEFPSLPEEAFQSTGNNFYPIEYVERLRQGVCDPIMVGDISGSEPTGEKALENVQLYAKSNGNLRIWKDIDNRPKVSDRYLVVVDIGGHSETSDNSVICVFDRYWMNEKDMGCPEVVAEWAGHIEWDLLAWKAAQLATYYDNALLVVESNTLDTKKNSEGNHFNTILTTIADYYPNLYRRTKAEQLVKGGPIRYGFHTNPSTKPMICDFQLFVLRDDLYIERCAEAVDEHSTFEIKQNGELGAVEGNRDDRHITRAIGNYFNYKIMPAPKFIKQNTPTTTTKQVSEMTMA
jgi:hypothetical protein